MTFDVTWGSSSAVHLTQTVHSNFTYPQIRFLDTCARIRRGVTKARNHVTLKPHLTRLASFHFTRQLPKPSVPISTLHKEPRVARQAFQTTFFDRTFPRYRNSYRGLFHIEPLANSLPPDCLHITYVRATEKCKAHA